MLEPDDFGLSVAATLARVGDPRPPAEFRTFWSRWREMVSALNPRLHPVREPDPSDTSATHEFESVQSVRIGCRFVRPPASGPTHAGLVVLHGYADPEPMDEQQRRWSGLIDRGVAVLILRVRGYPGSTLDTGLLTAAPGGWISHGLETAIDERSGQSAWSLSGAVADVVCAVRALRAAVPTGAGVFMHGESLGGALAVLASAQLGPMAPQRLGLALPSFGDWPWRLHRVSHPLGAAEDVQGVLVRHAREVDRVTNTLRLFDTVLHAPRVRGPMLCKLAERDEVVPAPSAAAVFNALSPSPTERWRYVTRYGHFDGGLADARRHAMFERVVDVFFDPAQEPGEGVFEWVKRESARRGDGPLAEG